MEHLIVLVTAPHEEAGRIQEALVRERLAACVNMVGADSFYIWEGKEERAKEALLIMKTTSRKLSGLVKRVKELHPYDVPEVIALPVSGGNADYLKWVSDSLE